jgi:uncharacterized protein YmfQ (DUF2313 family)
LEIKDMAAAAAVAAAAAEAARAAASAAAAAQTAAEVAAEGPPEWSALARDWEEVAATAAATAQAAARAEEDAQAMLRELGTFSEANPIRDILQSNKRGEVRVADADLAILEQLKCNPPQPTRQLIRMLKDSEIRG